MPCRGGGGAAAAIVATQAAVRAQAGNNKQGGAVDWLDSDDEENVQVVVDEPADKDKDADEQKPTGVMRSLRAAVGCVIEFISGDRMQFLMYIVYVLVFQLLADSVRMPEEFFFDKMIADTFIDNHFDSSHNTWSSIRRVADIYEWGNNVLIAGLLGNSGPCASDVGAAGIFDSSQFSGPNVSAAVRAKGCNDDVWPDGAGSFHIGGATGWTVAELAIKMDQLDWTEGLLIRQVRAVPTPTSECLSAPLSNVCFETPMDGAHPGGAEASTYGYNWTHPEAAPASSWAYHDANYWGTEPSEQSAFMPSLATYEGGGFAAAVVPFFSSTYLPEQRGRADDVIDFRAYAINAGGTRAVNEFCPATFPGPSSGNATGAAPPLPLSRTFNASHGGFFCVRLTHNGEFMHQLCDPNSPSAAAPDPLGRTTGAVRTAVEGWWNDLKRGHYIDLQTRFIQIVLPFRNSRHALRSRVKLMLEVTPYASVLPSYDMRTRIEGTQRWEEVTLYSNVAFGFCMLFMLLEVLEFSAGWKEYFFNIWNIMDWTNFALFLLFYSQLINLRSYEADRNCSPFCLDVGYCDDWLVMNTMMDAKTTLSYCLCIQMLKVIKFTDSLVPKMSLATSVLKKASVELLFFSFVFIISMVAFSQLFFISLGPVMEGYNTQTGSIVSLTRSLFGDFDIDAILNNSKDYLNTMLFLAYLFVAVFIMLSMFLAILGDAQGAVISSKNAKQPDREYGIFQDMSDFASTTAKQVGVIKAPVELPPPDPAEQLKKREKQRGQLPVRRKDLAAALSLMREDIVTSIREEADPAVGAVGRAGWSGGAASEAEARTAESRMVLQIANLVEDRLGARLEQLLGGGGGGELSGRSGSSGAGGLTSSASAAVLGSNQRPNDALGRARSHRRNLRRVDGSSTRTAASDAYTSVVTGEVVNGAQTNGV